VDEFGPIVTLRGILEPQGRWPEYLEGFTQLVERFDEGDGSARIRAEYLLTTVRRS
jgi:hypothetical protein